MSAASDGDISTQTEDVQQLSIALAVNINRTFDYITAHDNFAPYGAYVTVPFGKKSRTGIVWGPGSHEVTPDKCKIITHIDDILPPWSAAHRQFITKLAQYNCASLGNCLKLALPIATIADSARFMSIYRLSTPPPAFRLTQARESLLAFIGNGQRSHAEIRQAGYKPAVLQGLVDAGILRITKVRIDYGTPPALQLATVCLTDAQQEIIHAMQPHLEGYSRLVLDGATGAGKTEIYFDLAQRCIEAGKQVLILLPEIALSLQIVERAAKRFGITPVLWHSSVTQAQRKDGLLRIIHGGAPLIIGARSALFLPYRNLGLIVVDEEHDASYKQEDGVMYHARDMAVLRAQEEAIPVILASATPSLETMHNCAEGKYHHFLLHRRTAQADLPYIHIIDMRSQTMEKDHWISPTLQEALAATFADGQQSLLFLNRRGYAPLMLCRMCGHRCACPSCSAWLVYHKQAYRLQCHHCGLSVSMPKTCPSCDASAENLALCGPGIERIGEEINAVFPLARTLVLSGDSHGLQHDLDAITRGEYDIIIGTQLLAKGHHFPLLTTVGVVDMDAGLGGHDIRAGEKTYQLLHQLAGRAGREQQRGNVYIQTYRPDHPLMNALQSWDRAGFIQQEMAIRQTSMMPPYGRLAALIIEGKPEDRVISTAKQLAACVPQLDDVLVLGPAPAIMYKLRNLYRYRFLVRTPKHTHVQRIMQEWRASVSPPATVTIKIDIDPISFM